MSLKFGTDGLRGPAAEITDELVTALGRAAVRVLGADRFVIGRDPRESGPRLCAAFARGIAAEGAQPTQLGVAPTPAVAWVAAREGCAAAVVSASHNPWIDNGIKLFAPGGLKLADAVEARLEAEMATILGHAADARAAADPTAATADPTSDLEPDPVDAGRVAASLDGYRSALLESLGSRRLDGLRVVLDGANGAASGVAPDVVRRAGATVEVLHDRPDGRNINDRCGSTHPADLQAAVVAAGAHVGLAFDGDADRVLAVDEAGGLVDGDHLLAMLAIDRHRRGVLVGDAVVVTVMSNLGFRIAMERHGIGVVETAVGDRYVLEALEANGLALGGEQSGHVIFRDLATTGDGLLCGLQVLDLVVRDGRGLATLAAEAMTRLPQVLHSVRVAERRADVAEALAGPIAAQERRLGGSGRVLVRASGTEPLIRVMVEAPDEALAHDVARILADEVLALCGAPG